MGWLGFAACFLLIGLPIGLLIGSAILRGAVSLANKCVGSPKQSYYDDDDEDDWADYPRARGRRESSGKIPEPTLGRGMMIVLVVFIANAVVRYGIQVVFDIGVNAGPGVGRNPFQVRLFASQLIVLPVTFLIMSSLLAVMLPTSFPRGCLVTLFYYLICIAIAVIIFIPLFAFGVAAGIR